VAATIAVQCRSINVEYRSASGSTAALDGVDLTVERGLMTVVAGPSGSGKSSLLRVIAGLQRPTSGSVVIGGRDVSRLRSGARRRLRRTAMGIVVQNPSDNLIEYLTAVEQVRLAARLRGTDPAEAAELLRTVGLADRAACLPAELSGGEQQRVAFAAAAVGSPLLLLADEPTAQLDDTSGRSLLDAVRGLIDAGTTVVMASHDLDAIAAADHVVRLRDGRVVER
jgi:ABC-type lipoprotein export system ATPase subunit